MCSPANQQWFLLYADSQRSRWPPTPGASLLPGDDPLLIAMLEKPQADWDCDDWRRYAMFLEDRGGELAERQQREKQRNSELRNRLRRGKAKALGGSLLTPVPANKRGAPKKKISIPIERGLELLKIKEKNNLSTNAETVRFYLRQQNPQRSDVWVNSQAEKHRGWLNDMSAAKKYIHK